MSGETLSEFPVCDAENRDLRGGSRSTDLPPDSGLHSSRLARDHPAIRFRDPMPESDSPFARRARPGGHSSRCSSLKNLEDGGSSLEGGNSRRGRSAFRFYRATSNGMSSKEEAHCGASRCHGTSELIRAGNHWNSAFRQAKAAIRSSCGRCVLKSGRAAGDDPRVATTTTDKCGQLPGNVSNRRLSPEYSRTCTSRP